MFSLVKEKIKETASLFRQCNDEKERIFKKYLKINRKRMEKETQTEKNTKNSMFDHMLIWVNKIKHKEFPFIGS